jgi:hypothetical protein|tara:strand:- start:172 stop:354 length:183 start_codon:yes stop_codon:yes gene_type:complete
MINFLIFAGFMSAAGIVDQSDAGIVTVELTSGEIVTCDAAEFKTAPVEGQALSTVPTSCG